MVPESDSLIASILRGRARLGTHGDKGPHLFQNFGADAVSAGVRVAQVIQDNTPARRIHDPSNPLADSDGMVTMPNVNPVEEMVNMISASRSYQTNVDVMNTAKTLLQKVLQLGT